MIHDIIHPEIRIMTIVQTPTLKTATRSKITISGIMLLLGAILVLLKAVGATQLGWGVVLIPFYVWFAFFVVKFLFFGGLFALIAVVAGNSK